MDLINEIVSRAQANKQRIVLPEGTEERTLKAANQILTDEVADLILLGNPDEINEAGGVNGKMLELIAEDSEGTVDKAIASYEKLAYSDNVLAIIGPITAGRPPISVRAIWTVRCRTSIKP